MPRPDDRTPLGDSISEIIDRTTKIVHEEIELAKAEMAVALQDLLRGSVAGIVGGVFAFFGLFILLIAFSFLVADAVGVWYPWLGFFIVAFICFIVGGALAFVALKKIKKGSQLAPSQAIDEAKQTRSALKAEPEDATETIEAEVVEETLPEASAKPAEGSESVAVTAPAPVVAAATPAGARTASAEAAEELDDAREAAEELELDAKEAKRRAKQEAKEAKEAAKAARKAEAEAAKAEAIAAKAAQKAAAEAEKERSKAEKQAAKDAKKAARSGAAPAAEQPAGEQPAGEQPARQSYSPPQPPAQPSVPQTPPPPPNDPTGGQ